MPSVLVGARPHGPDVPTQSLGRSSSAHRPLRSTGVLLVLTALLAALVALPANAATTQTITGYGDQNGGRWQVFSLNSDLRGVPVTVTTTWSGGGNVNVYLKTWEDKTVASERDYQTSGPTTFTHDGTPRPNKVAVYVKTGRASYTVKITSGAAAPAPATGYPGRPANGKIYFGASQEGNEDPWNRLERYSGDRLGVRRTFFRWDQRAGYMVRIAKEDTTVGRLPWVSVKPPSWRDMGNGVHDGGIDQMLRALDGVPGPVWLTVAHEPEGGGGSNNPDQAGGAAAWLKMQQRVRSRMDRLGVDNVALVPIFMTWTWDPRSGRNPNDWYAPGVFDLLGTDYYDRLDTGLPMPGGAWEAQRKWAKARGLDMAVGEWGIRGSNTTAANRVRDWHRHIVNTASDGGGARVVAMSVYDNNYDGWRLSGERLTAIRQLVPHSANINP